MSESNGLPKGWAEATLAEACCVLLGSSPPGSTYNPEGRGLPFFQGKAEFGDLYPTPVKYCDSPVTVAEKDDVLISVRAPVGPTNLCPSTSCIGRGLAVIRSLAEVPPKYVLYAIRATVARLAEKATGTTFTAINGSQLREHRLRLAPLPEQHRIVEKIEELFSDLDAGVSALKRAKANLKRYRASVLKSAVEGRLTEEWRKEHPQAEDGAFLEDNWVLLEEVITLLGQGWSPKCESAPATDDAEWAVIKTSAIQSMVFLPDENKQLPDTLTPRPELVIEPGDLLITRAGPRTRAGVTCLVRHTRPRLILCDKAYRVRFDETRAFPAFVEVVLNSPRFLDRLDELKTGISDSGVNLTQKKFVEMPIPLPPLAEQEQIVLLVEERLSQIDSAEKTIDAELIRAKRLRQSILKRAFEGKLVPQDPKDEPASVLLEQIKASKDTEQPKKKTKKVKAKSK